MLYKTHHGSTLYGLAHAGSDDDYYVVVNTRRNRRPKYAKQSFADNKDTTTVDWGTWVNFCQMGVPQALEAMFSQMPVYEAEGIREFRNAFRFGSTARDRYVRTIDNFLADGTLKKNRHALRLALNLRDGLRYGRFNPTLSSRQAIWVTYHAKNSSPDELWDMCMRLHQT